VLALNGKPYRGTLTALPNGKVLDVVNTLGLDQYLYGVVPSEMPYFWNAEALKAQAIAARSYALATRQPDAPYDVFADTRSQVYGGIAAEHGETSSAVDATKGTVALYGGQVATTYFHSTSGGRTAAIADEWPRSKPAPYLVSVSDPYDTLSPYHNWGPVTFTGARLAAALKAPGTVLDLTPAANRSGRVGSLSVTAARGTVTVDGATLRAALGLRSTWFTIGVLSLAPPPGPIVYGSQLQLTATVRGLAGQPVLEQRARTSAGASWLAVPFVPGLEGSFTAGVQALATTDYRLTVGAAQLVVRVPVSPQVSLRQAPSLLSGSVQPIAAGTAVDVQRQDGTAWSVVATATVAPDGSFSAPGPVEPGAAYRAVVPAGGGLATGVSPVLVAQSG